MVNHVVIVREMLATSANKFVRRFRSMGGRVDVPDKRRIKLELIFQEMPMP
jgi:hypothetical protein